MRSLSLFFLFVLPLVVLIGCDSSNDFLEPEPVEIPDPRFVNEDDYSITESGLKIFDFTVGPGALADSNLVVRVHYIMWLAEDSSIVASSFFSGQPSLTQLGSSNFISGMEEGIIGMQVGGDRQIIVPPFLGFGGAGEPSLNVPPDATLIVEVALLGVGVVQ